MSTKSQIVKSEIDPVIQELWDHKRALEIQRDILALQWEIKQLEYYLEHGTISNQGEEERV